MAIPVLDQNSRRSARQVLPLGLADTRLITSVSSCRAVKRGIEMVGAGREVDKTGSERYEAEWRTPFAAPFRIVVSDRLVPK